MTTDSHEVSRVSNNTLVPDGKGFTQGHYSYCIGEDVVNGGCKYSITDENFPSTYSGMTGTKFIMNPVYEQYKREGKDEGIVRECPSHWNGDMKTFKQEVLSGKVKFESCGLS